MPNQDIESRIGEYWGQNPDDRSFKFYLEDYPGVDMLGFRSTCKNLEANEGRIIDIVNAVGTLAADGTIKNHIVETVPSSILDIHRLHGMLKNLS